METKKEQRMRLEKLRQKDKKNDKIVYLYVLIDWMPQSVVTLYIYWVGRSCPTRKSFHKSKSIRTPQFDLDSGDRSDRLSLPVIPVAH